MNDIIGTIIASLVTAGASVLAVIITTSKQQAISSAKQHEEIAVMSAKIDSLAKKIDEIADIKDTVGKLNTRVAVLELEVNYIKEST